MPLSKHALEVTKAALLTMRGRGEPGEVAAVDEVLPEIDKALALHEEAEETNVDLLSDGQKIDTAIEALDFALPQYRVAKAEIDTQDRGDHSASIITITLEWVMG